ncbi:MAG: beta-Ala-His dipeptidase [Clostridia bacterium]
MNKRPFIPQSGIERAFATIAAIPHASKDERALSDFLLSRYRARGLWAEQDDMGNLLVKKPGVAAGAERPAVLLCAHLDMVSAKEKESTHDFATDPLALYVDEAGWLRADGTTLGADDGYGVAYMMDLLDRDDVVHPPLECLFTVQEEIGLCGAAGYDYKDICARRVISMDSGELCTTTIASAGGERLAFALPLEKAETNGLAPLAITIEGLAGGHSGGEIDKGRANALLILGEMLSRIAENEQAILLSLDGGCAHNAIARAAEAVIAVSPKRVQAVYAQVAEATARCRATFEQESEMQISIHPAKCAQETGYLLRAAADFLCALPSGVYRMSESRHGMVMTSANLGVASLAEGTLHVLVMMRSVKRETALFWESTYRAIARAFRAELVVDSVYPGWTYQPESPMREAVARVLKEVTGNTLRMKPTHGGLEVGYFADNLPGADIVTLGCDLEKLHAPGEKMDLASFETGYRVLLGVLKSLAEEK